MAMGSGARGGANRTLLGASGAGGEPSLMLFTGLVALIAVAVAVVNTLSKAADLADGGQPVPFWQPATWEVTSGLVLVALAPAVALWTRWAPVTRERPWRWLAAHLAGSVVFSLAHVLLMGAARAAVYALAHHRYDPWTPLRGWGYEYRKDLLTYAVLVAIYSLFKALRNAAQGQAEAAAAAAQAQENAAAVVSPPPIEVRDGARRFFVRPDEVMWIEAAGNYAELHLADRMVLHRTSLAALEGGDFVRVHRSRLVNRGQVAGVETNAAGDFVVTLRDGRSVVGSRRYRSALLAPASA